MMYKKREALAQTEIQIEQAKSQLEIQRMQQELQNLNNS